MNQENLKLAEYLLPKTYVEHANNGIKSRENLIKILLEHRKLPINGWDEITIEHFLNSLSAMDSNNFIKNCGAGEREGRIFCNLVAKRNYRFAHGIGKSGYLNEIQPKAVGSSLLNILTNDLLLDLIRFMGIRKVAGCSLMPVATGMTLSLCLLTFKQSRANAKYVIWPRIDQQSCFKCILTTCLEPIIIEPKLIEGALVTDIANIESSISDLGVENIVCVLSTTSCFAPREPDLIVAISVLCKKHNIPHIINNSYGLQSNRICNLIQEASNKGRVDVFVQSTDKNLLVPVGGAIISCFDLDILNKIVQNYPGRATCNIALDVLITLLTLGKNGFQQLVKDRIDTFSYLKDELIKISAKINAQVINTKHNPLSLAMKLPNNLLDDNITYLGSMLFVRQVSGTRIISDGVVKPVGSFKFQNWGTHRSLSCSPYITVAATIGMTKTDVDIFIKRLCSSITEIEKNGSHAK